MSVPKVLIVLSNVFNLSVNNYVGCVRLNVVWLDFHSENVNMCVSLLAVRFNAARFNSAPESLISLC